MKFNKLIVLFTVLISFSLSFSSVRADTDEGIIGSDNRVVVSNTTISPYKSIVQITSNGTPTGTGTLIDKDLVVTSAHVVFNKYTKQYRQNLEVYPGLKKNYAPYGSSTIKDVVASPTYISNSQISNDFAVIKLSKPLGNTTGYLSLSTNVVQDMEVTLTGYPEDTRTMMTDKGTIAKITNGVLYYSIDTEPGQSGSAVLNRNNQIIAIHHGAVDSKYNCAASIKQELFNLINQIKSSNGNVYRLYNPNNGLHFFTNNVAEKNQLVNLGWKDEGIAWRSGSNSPVYRLYNKNSGQHFFTADYSEKNNLVKAGWKDEGIAFYTGNTLNVYRLYNKNNTDHIYTVDYTERDNLIISGWTYEGIAFKTR